MTDSPLAAALALVPEPGGRVILALAGPPAAGKSTLAQALVAGVNSRLGADTAAYVPLDGFHLSNLQLARLGFTDRKGAAFTFDVHGYLALLRRLLSETAISIYVPDYDRTLHEPIAARHVVSPRVRLIVTEGNYLAGPQDGWREVSDLAEELWFVEAPEAVRDARLVRRQMDGGRSLAQARDWVEFNDRLNADLVAPDRARCDRIITVPLKREP